MADITMPQLGETVTEGTITKWFKSVGDEIQEDEPLFEVSTDKVDSEVPSPESGYLAEILVDEGETVDVGTKLAVVSSEAPSGDGQQAQSGKETKAEEEEKVAEAAEASEAEAEEPAEQQEEDEAAEEVPEETDQAPEEADQAPEEEARPAKAEAEAEQARAQTKTEERPTRPSNGDGRGGGAGKVLSPVVRKLIAEHDLDPDQIEGTGQGGRITRADVLAVIDSGKTKPAAAPKREEKAAPRREEPPARPAAAAPAPAARAEAAPAARAGEDDEAIAFSNIRRRTAEHMVRSKATSAHVLTAIEVDYESVDRVRGAAQREWKEREGFTLTYLPFVSRAVIDAIEDFPHVNASVGDDELIVHRRVHLGIAVDLSFQGLLAPVIHDADGKRLRAIAREIHDLAARARAKKLSADEIQGGTFTITNPGGYGTLITAAIINQPQVAILSTDGVKKKPVAVELPDGTDGIAVHPVGLLALSFDHRAFDGAYASAFIARVKEILETRDWSQEL